MSIINLSMERDNRKDVEKGPWDACVKNTRNMSGKDVLCCGWFGWYVLDSFAPLYQNFRIKVELDLNLSVYQYLVVQRWKPMFYLID